MEDYTIKTSDTPNPESCLFWGDLLVAHYINTPKAAPADDAPWSLHPCFRLPVGLLFLLCCCGGRSCDAFPHTRASHDRRQGSLRPRCKRAVGLVWISCKIPGRRRARREDYSIVHLAPVEQVWIPRLPGPVGQATLALWSQLISSHATSVRKAKVQDSIETTGFISCRGAGGYGEMVAQTHRGAHWSHR